MASPTETITALVLRRTKLGETDVIVTLLAEDGSLRKAVAKGARKPTSTFASRLELYSIATLLLAQGRSLDIVKEARLVEGNSDLRADFILSSAAAPLVELLSKATFEDQPTPRLFDLTKRALETLAATKGNPLIITLAALLKMLAFLGFRPAFQECIECGDAIDLTHEGSQPFSYFDGGSVCTTCAPRHETTPLDTQVLLWCHVLLYSTLDEASTLQIPDQSLAAAFRFINEWIKLHLGINMRSLTFLFKNIL